MKNLEMKKTLLIVLILAILVLGIVGLAVTYYTTQLSMVLNGNETITVGLNAVYDDPE